MDANSVGVKLDGGAKRVDSSKPLHHIYKEDNKYYNNRDFFDIWISWICI